MLPVTFEPIDAWPGPVTKSRQTAKFTSSYPQTLALLEAELYAVNAKNVTLQLAVSWREVRRDGLPKSDAKPVHPGVMLGFEDRRGPMLYTCDTYTHWHANLRAIAKTLESLRDIGRWGATGQGQQYEGFRKSLPATTLQEPALTAPGSAEEAAAIIAELAGQDRGLGAALLADLILARSIHKIAVARVRPDLSGNEEQARRLNAAWELLKARHGL